MAGKRGRKPRTGGKTVPLAAHISIELKKRLFKELVDEQITYNAWLVRALEIYLAERNFLKGERKDDKNREAQSEVSVLRSGTVRLGG